MGEKLIRYYNYLAEREGLSGKVELAQRTKIPSTRASTVPDSAENVALFREAIADLTGEQPPRF